MRAHLLGALVLVVFGAVPAAAQKAERGYISVSSGANVPTETLRERFTYPLNAEEATTEATYRRTTGRQFDAGAGLRLRRRLGAAIHVSRSSSAGSARTTSRLPHPLLDDRDRQVEGDAGDLSRIETATHAQLYYLRQSGRWRLRFSAGPSYVRIEQEVVTAITVDEAYPFDTASFRSATTARVRGSAAGFNAGVDLNWMLTRRLAAGSLVRFSRAEVDMDAGNGRRVETSGGGAQVTAGIQVSF